MKQLKCFVLTNTFKVSSCGLSPSEVVTRRQCAGSLPLVRQRTPRSEDVPAAALEREQWVFLSCCVPAVRAFHRTFVEVRTRLWRAPLCLLPGSVTSCHQTSPVPALAGRMAGLSLLLCPWLTLQTLLLLITTMYISQEFGHTVTTSLNEALCV